MINYSIKADFKSWENYPDKSCELFDMVGHSLAKFFGEIYSIGGYLYVYQQTSFYDIVIDNNEYRLVKHESSSFPVLI